MTAQTIPEGYKPTHTEEYMNPTMMLYFKNKLIAWREKLLTDLSLIKNDISTLTEKTPDFVDSGENEELKTPEYSKAENDLILLQEIDKALEKITDGSYGYCEETKRPIGIERLESWPMAALSREAQEERESEYS